MTDFVGKKGVKLCHETQTGAQVTDALTQGDPELEETQKLTSESNDKVQGDQHKAFHIV